MNDKKLNAMVEFYYERHVEGECLKDLFREIYLAGNGCGIRAMQKHSLISELRASQDVLSDPMLRKEMERRAGEKI